MNAHHRSAKWLVACLLSIATALSAQTPSAPAAPGVPALPADAPFERIALTVGRSHVLSTSFDVTRLAVNNPAIADAIDVAPREILIDAKGPGVTSLILWGFGQRVQYDIVVESGQPPMQAQMDSIFPGEDIRISSTDDVIVLSGNASTSEIALRAGEIVQASTTKKVINMLQRPGVSDSQQVMLEVRFAEVDHNAMLELGTSLLARRPNFDARFSTEQFPTPFIDDSKTQAPIQIPDYLNIFFFLRKDGIMAVLKALQQRGLFQTLAEPNLIAYNGQEASFLAGGEFPVPIVQGNSGQVTIQFKEFGVRLTFTPRISGDVIRLKVRPEVSTLDFVNGLTLSGFRVPALKTRRAETDVELRDGQSFAIAGLLNNESFESRQAIPLLGSIPIVGHLFKSKTESSNRTELLVLITPHLVRPLDPAEVPPLPTDPKMFIKPSGDVGGLLEGGGGLVDGPAPKPAAKERKQ